MATSGNNVFNITRDEVITDALQMLQVLGEGEDANADQISDSVRPLNKMLKAMSVLGLHIWKVDTVAFNLAQGQTSYTNNVGGDVNATKFNKVYNAIIRRDAFDTDLTLITRDEYELLGDKSAQGVPNQYWYDPRREVGSFTVYPAPSADAAANTLVLVTGTHPIEDVDTGVDNMDVPVEWLDAITYGLALRLMHAYGTPSDIRREIISLASTFLKQATDFDQEEGSIFLQPEPRFTNG